MSAIRRSDRGGEWWVDFQLDGRRVRRRSPVQSKSGARALEEELRVELRRGGGLLPPGRSCVSESEAAAAPRAATSPLTFAAYLNDYYFPLYVDAQMRPSTRRTVKCQMRANVLPFFGEIPLVDITAIDIARFGISQASKRLSPKSINNHLSMFRNAYVTAKELFGLIDRDVPRFKWKQVSKNDDYPFLSSEQVSRLVAAASPDFWRPLVLFLLRTGARFGEAAALRWEDLVLDGPTPTVHIRRGVAVNVVGLTKTGRDRKVPLGPALVAELRRFRHDREFVFVRPADGKFLSPASTRKHLHKICDRAGVPRIGWHTLRHTFATELTARQVSLRIVQKLLGHTSIKTTERYVHASEDTLHESVLLLEMNAKFTPANDVENIAKSPPESPPSGLPQLRASSTRSNVIAEAPLH